MRIGIDYTAAVRQGGGIGRYTRNLVRALSDLDGENDYRLFVAGGWGEGDGQGPWPDNFEIRAIPLADRWVHLLWQRLRLPLPVQAVTGSLDLFHSPDFVLPPTGKTPALLTVHDLSFLKVPDCYVPAFRRYLERAVRRAAERADLILADSDSTKRDLVELMQVRPEKVAVVYPGVEARFRHMSDPHLLEPVRKRYRLPDRFILGLGTLQPRKNFEGLVEGFRRLILARGDEPVVSGLGLVIAGGEGWMVEQTYAAVKGKDLEDRVHFAGFVDDGDLPTLYNLASVFAFPTWYEGFGLPVLEAMACGTPVVCADNSSLPEVAGEAALLVNAGDPDALAHALYRALVDGNLRAWMASEGPNQASRFTWEAAALGLLSLYQSFA